MARINLINRLVICAAVVLTGVMPASAAKKRVKTAPKAPVEKPTPSADALPDGHGDLKAQGAIVLDALSGLPIYEKNENDRLFPASTTKILTALLIIEAGDLDKEVTIEEPETKAEPSKLYIKTGEKYTRREMLYAILLKSANDVAEALARDNAGSVEAFAEKMTRRAHALGAVSSHFANPHGLPDPQHYTTAHDLALIARAAMEQPFFRTLVSTQTHPWVSPKGVTELFNKNRLLKQFPGCTGLKTGWTYAAGHTLVSAALRDHREVIAVVLKTDKRGIWEDSKRLLEYGLENLPAPPSIQILTRAGTVLNSQN
jgi:D-alanyl-D-alanine carboxypeptidase (penicillin-binding protein 5/6)